MDEEAKEEKTPEQVSRRKLGDVALTLLKEEILKQEKVQIVKRDPIYADDVDIGEIDLSFPEHPDAEFHGQTVFPESYYTLSPKERLVLLFADNFRRQFLVNYPNRQPLVLAIPNECGVQKFVCMTLRPTGFLIPELIGSLKECAKFVADFILYEPLEDPINLPKRLISPDTLLRHRQGNSFEMATLLCSMLIGAGFAAVVVAGRAVRETTINDQRKVVCPYIPQKNHEEEKEKQQTSVEQNKYTLREPPDLRSRFILQEEERKAQEERDEQERQFQAEIERQELLEREPDDSFENRRLHAWVAVIENAPWCYKPKEPVKLPEGSEEPVEVIKAFFIEPSTGFRHEVNSSNYVHIESVWNQYNYYINVQKCSIADMRWDLGLSEDWQCFLPGEPYELRVENPEVKEVEVAPEVAPKVVIVQEEKHLDLIPSWVQQLRISFRDFEERYPNQEKVIYYKRALHERFSPYSKKDGLCTRLTVFEDSGYEQPTMRWEWYQNREDCLELIKNDYETKKIEESFVKGRLDCLKFYEHSEELDKPQLFHFYHMPRLDSLKLLELSIDRIAMHFEKRDDLCFYREYLIKPKRNSTLDKKSVTQITEKYNRNPNVPVTNDIAIRQYQFLHNKIFLKYHYAKDAITASTREFIKPPKPEYGREVEFDPDATSGYKANPFEPDPTPVELYLLLIAELANEEKLKRGFGKLGNEIDAILSNRKQEMLEPKLKFSVFDPLRNQGARILRIKQYEEDKHQRELSLLREADFLSPYLVLYEDREPNYRESQAAYEACLKDVKARYTNLLNNLQRRYEDLTSEAKSLKKFLYKFQDQFDDYDYERLVKEGREIELNRRMVQQRLILTHEEAERKYEHIKLNLLQDKRLNLNLKEPYKEV